MKTTIFHALAFTGLLAGATFAVCAATPGLHASGPPTADQLGLAGADAAQWTALRDATIDLRDSARATAQHEIDTLRALLASDAPDLDAFDREIEQAIDRHAAAARALRQRKLAFYDRLAPDQQAKLRAAMLDRLNRIDRLRSALLELGDTP
jgi:Spy/CpxP family protein refolding chaperone